MLYNLLKGDLIVVGSESYYDREQEEHNLQLARGLMARQGYRSPWGDDREMRQFRSETESALSDGPDHFRIKPALAALSHNPAQRGLLAGLFRRA